jgi:hypothetical protein
MPWRREHGLRLTSRSLPAAILGVSALAGLIWWTAGRAR